MLRVLVLVNFVHSILSVKEESIAYRDDISPPIRAHALMFPKYLGVINCPFSDLHKLDDPIVLTVLCHHPIAIRIL